MRLLTLLATIIPVAAAQAHPSHATSLHRGGLGGDTRAQWTCSPAEVRISSPDDAWFDLLVDGERRIEARGFSTPEAIRLDAGRHHFRTTDFMGDAWSDHALNLGCSEVVVVEILDDRGLFVLTRFGAQSPPRPEPRGYWGSYDWHWRPADRPEARVCSSSELLVLPGDDWYDVYVDGDKVVENRSFSRAARVEGLLPGTHFIRVTDLFGHTLAERHLDVGCGETLATTFSEERGLRVL